MAFEQAGIKEQIRQNLALPLHALWVFWFPFHKFKNQSAGNCRQINRKGGMIVLTTGDKMTAQSPLQSLNGELNKIFFRII
jgi:hypothetical protein